MQIVVYLSAAVLAGVIGSLLTKRTDKEKIERFHELIRTPVLAGEVVTESCRLPEGVRASKRKTWFAGTDFEFPSPSRTSWLGFTAGWIAVAAMIGGFVWLIS